jgi:tripeptide aminopeptidase
MKVDSARISNTFMKLASIDSPSGREGAIAEHIKNICVRELGMETRVDDTSGETGSETGNMVATLPGDKDVPPLFFNAHMDTVEPGTGVVPRLENGIFVSEGDTVLGADDKAGIAIMVETVRILREKRIPHGDIELLFTVSEETGLVGAKAMSPDFIRARHGYALDSSYPDAVITRAPAAIRIDAEFTGKAAHAGLHPEKGINAIQMAARAVAAMPLGRIDHETTANMGIISGGQATNIIPEKCVIRGEVRSHDALKLAKTRDTILAAMHSACMEAGRAAEEETHDDAPPWLHTTVREDYPLMDVPEDSPLVKAVMKAGDALGRELKISETGGGSDANIFNGKGIEAVILGIGMTNVHTTREYIRLEDMTRTTALAVEIIKKWGA